MTDLATLDEWLAYIGQVHPRSIEMGLERILRVAERLGVLPPAPLNLVVAGTNGKGSTTVSASALLRARGMKVGTALSPHLRRFNERIQIDGREVDDVTICAALTEVERARGAVLLTYFEFSILATLLIFRRARCDATVLEVGLGGRLDAVNLVDADVSVITSIGIDHVEYLGPDRESIGAEKAGILRTGVPLVYGENHPPESVLSRARALMAPLYERDRAFGATPTANGFRLWFTTKTGMVSLDGLPLPRLAIGNVATAAQAVALTAERGPDRSDVLKAIELAALPGRFERFRHFGRDVIVDVAHNPHGAAFLARQLALTRSTGRTCAIAGFLKDKNAAGIVAELRDEIDDWTFVETRTDRGQSAERCFERARSALPLNESVRARALSLADALAAVQHVPEGDRTVVLGSFDVVERASDALRRGEA
jgi:dihydrofolate synthase/folylpolyglutamate synthase